MTEPLQNTDVPLLVRHRGGDPAAFAELVARFWKPVHNYLYRCGLDRATREDLLQDIFAKIHLNADAYRPDRPLQVWVYTVAANTTRDHLRKQSTRAVAQQVQIAPDDLGTPEPAHDQIAEANETLNCLATAMRELPISQREVLVLSSIEGLTGPEVAEVLGVPLNTVKTQLRRARFSLARALARHRLRGEREGE